MFLLSVLVAALLVVLTALQATYPNEERVKTPLFKFLIMIIAGISAVLMVVGSYREHQSKERTQFALEGLSQTVFPRDIELDFSASYSPGEPITSFLDEAFVMVAVISPQSSNFCRWGVTHTPTVDSAVGELFMRYENPPSSAANSAFFDRTAQLYKFPLMAHVSGTIAHLRGRVEAVPIVMEPLLPLDRYAESQFIVEVVVPGRVRDVQQAILYIKGKRVPLHIVDTGRGWMGSTVFRPTWERRCQAKSR